MVTKVTGAVWVNNDGSQEPGRDGPAVPPSLACFRRISIFSMLRGRGASAGHSWVTTPSHSEHRTLVPRRLSSSLKCHQICVCEIIRLLQGKQWHSSRLEQNLRNGNSFEVCVRVCVFLNFSFLTCRSFYFYKLIVANLSKMTQYVYCKFKLKTTLWPFVVLSRFSCSRQQPFQHQTFLCQLKLVKRWARDRVGGNSAAWLNLPIAADANIVRAAGLPGRWGRLWKHLMWGRKGQERSRCVFYSHWLTINVNKKTTRRAAEIWCFRSRTNR